ncbi:sugar ABC transporter substrate-binding protein [Nocardioides endophyticus]
MSFGGSDVYIWNQILDIMRKDIEASGYEFLTDDPQWDVAKQASDWDTWATRGDVKAIMGWPIEANALGPVTKRINDKNIPVLGYAATWDGVDASFLTDAHKEGVAMGDDVAKWITEKYGADAAVDVGIFHTSDAQIGRDRLAGEKEALEAALPNVQIHHVNGISREVGYEGVKRVLTAHPDTKVWIGDNEAVLGAYKALKEDGVAADDPDYFLGALDVTNESLDLLKVKDSILRSAYVYRPEDVAEVCVKLLLAAAAGEKVEDLYASNSPVTAETADQFYTK